VLGIPALVGIAPKAINPAAADDAAHHLANLLSGGQLYTILETGPLTNIADALEIDPSVKRHINRLAAQPSVASQLAAQAMRLAITSAGTDQYYFWDTLAAAALLDPRGSPLDVAIDASRERVEKMFLDLLGR
jgi:inosine-uridine nucleoside N-ribohydrolase